MNSKEKFTRLRDQSRLTNEELAAALGVSYASICAYGSVSNRRHPPAAFLARMETLIVQNAVTQLEGLGYQVVKRAA